MEGLLKAFTEDPTVIALAVLVGLDVLLGVAAALKNKTFKFVILADFLRADVLSKLVPYYGVWAALQLTGDIEIGDLELIEESVGAIALAALAASILNSLRDLGAGTQLPDSVAGPDPTTPG
jgi:hypothetical protein